MTEYVTSSARFYTSLEEAKQHKPADKPSWVLFEIAGTDKNGEAITVYGWSGGAAVIGWQVACHFGWSATKAEGKRGNTAALAAKEAENAELRERLAKLEAMLAANEPTNRVRGRGRRNEEPAQAPAGIDE